MPPTFCFWWRSCRSLVRYTSLSRCSSTIMRISSSCATTPASRSSTSARQRRPGPFRCGEGGKAERLGSACVYLMFFTFLTSACMRSGQDCCVPSLEKKCADAFQLQKRHFFARARERQALDKQPRGHHHRHHHQGVEVKTHL